MSVFWNRYMVFSTVAKTLTSMKAGVYNSSAVAHRRFAPASFSYQPLLRPGGGGM